MYRRVVSLFLLPYVLLTQAAAFGHSHGGSQPAGHDLRPHIHTTRAPAGHRHDHGRHHHGGGGHHHDADNVTSDAPTTPTFPHPEPLPDHDSDAIYINAADVVVERSKPASEIAPSVWWTAAEADVFAKDWADPPAHSAFCGHPPPLYGQFCPLYIRHLALLI